MEDSKSSGGYRPFKQLRSLLESKSIVLKSLQADIDPESAGQEAEADPETDRRLFDEAMRDVAPIRRNTFSGARPDPPATKVTGRHESDGDTLRRLRRLVECGEGFVIADTAEYTDGVGHRVHPGLTRLLHQGHFSIQAHIDLHGLTVKESRAALDRFIQEAILEGLRAVLVVHGRGLSSPQKPVLKSKVVEWLTCGTWRKWVIAFSSARACDGGTGATYILLRRRPLTRRYRRRRSRGFDSKESSS